MLGLLGLDDGESYHAYALQHINIVDDTGYMGAASQSGINSLDYLPNHRLAAFTDVPNQTNNPLAQQDGINSKNRPTTYAILAAQSSLTAEGEPIRSFIERDDANHGLSVQGRPGARAVDHPVFSEVVSEVELLENHRVTEYAFGVERSNNVRILPCSNQQSMAYQSIHTEALRFALPRPTVRQMATAAREAHADFDESALRFLGHELLASQNNTLRSAFHVDAFLDLLSARIWDLNDESWPETAHAAFSCLPGLEYEPTQHLAYARALGADTLTPNEVEQMQETFVFAGELWLNDGLGEHFDERYLAWIEHSIVHGFASLYKSSAAEYSGTDDFGLGYVIHQREDDWLIDVYDAAHGGNGASRMVATYMHLPDLERDLIARAEIDHLPTTSFGDLVESNVGLCLEHILSEVAVRNSEVPDVYEHNLGQDVDLFRQRAQEVWNHLNITNARQAELHLRRRWADPIPAGMEEARHYLERELALDMCGVECDSCRLNDASIHPPHVARFLSVRSHLDVALAHAVFDAADGSYMRHREQQTEIRNLAGTNVAGFPPR